MEEVTTYVKLGGESSPVRTYAYEVIGGGGVIVQTTHNTHLTTVHLPNASIQYVGSEAQLCTKSGNMMGGPLCS